MKFNSKHMWTLIVTFGIFCLATQEPLFAQHSGQPIRLKKLSLEQLLQIEVTTASRKPQALSSAAGAVAVLTSERIRRSGATTLPDVLRLAAGIHVIRFDARSWGVSAHGLNLNTANKLQVLMDGRILYTPLFGGVFWDVQDYVLQDIDRIEVTRGPGAALWGGNAVNGVVNIQTLSAQDTQGGLIEAGGGDEENAFVTARYGSKIGNATFYRGYFKFFDRDGLVFANGLDARDDWQMGRGGFRMDSDITQTSIVTIQGDVYRGEQTFPDREDGIVSGGNLLGRWQRLFREDSDLQLLVYYDRSDRKIPLQFQEKRNTFDIDLQHRFRAAARHDFVWGFNYRASADQTSDIGTIQFEPPDRTIHHFSGFIQDDISIVPDKLVIVVGTKIEDNTFSDIEVQPNFRIVWMQHTNHNLWGAVSRAVRVPSRLDTDIRVFTAPGLLSFKGNPDFKPEEVFAMEAGYRISPRPGLFFDASIFHNSYNSLITLEAGTPGDPATIGNGLDATITGGTISANFEPLSWIRSIGSLTVLHKDIDFDPNSRDISAAAGAGNDPDFYWALHLMMDPIRDFQTDLILRSSGELPSPPVPGYVTMDFRLAWLATQKLELSITAQNLFHKSHPEFGAPGPTRKEVKRGVYGKLTWFF